MEKEKIALVLGGGGSRGAYEIGVWQALRELGIKIDIVTGTSVGAINAALVVQNDFELALEVWKVLETNMIFETSPKKIIAKRGVESIGLEKILSEYISDDRILDSSMEYGLVVAGLPSFAPHYLYKEDIPKGEIKDYIAASASCFPAVKSRAIGDTQYVDGGYIDNLPVGMALEKGATFVIAVNLDSLGLIHKEDFKHAKRLQIIESAWSLGNFLLFDIKNSKRIIRLGYLDTMKAFKVFDGSYYTFAKGEFDKRSLKTAEIAAKIFDLDPLCIYTKFAFDRNLHSKIKETNAKKKVNRKTLTLMIAGSLNKVPEEKNLFLSKIGFKLLRDEIRAAAYLFGRNLVN